MRRALGLIGATVAVLALTAPGAAAVDRVVSIHSNGPGPEAYDNVFVHQMGPKNPDQVLVLMPGTIAGGGDFTLLGRDLVKRVDGLAVWAIDRRSQALEDTAVFDSALAGETSLQDAYDYYLGWITNGGQPADHFQFLNGDDYPFAREWGMKTALKDARKVVLEAKAPGREVLLGGHSLGASLTAAYAAWDFGGRAGAEDVDGLVLIDGGLLGSFDAYDLEQAQQQIADLNESNPFLDLLGIGIPESAGLFAEVGGMYAKLDPTGSAEQLQTSPLLPAEFKPPVITTNRGLLGYAFDRDTSPAGLSLLHVNAGGLADAGDPRDWVDGGVTPIARLADTFGQEPSNGVEWYFPKRLSIDTNGANEMKRNDVAKFLGLRLSHTRDIDVPIYAFQTDLTDGSVLAGARRLVKRAKTPKSESMLVNGAPAQSHLDPLTAASSKNKFFKTVVRFVGDID